MHHYTLAHLSDAALLRELAALVARDRITTAELLAHIAEVDARKLYVPAGYPSMFEYCVEELRLSEDAAAKRIHSARAARRFPALFVALADGRLHLTAVCLLAPHLTTDNLDQLVQAATHRKKSEIEIWLATRSTTLEKRAVIRVVPPSGPRVSSQHAPGHVAVEPLSLDVTASSREGQLEHAPGHVVAAAVPAEERYHVQVTVSKSTHDKLRHAQALLSHAVSRGDVAQVIDRALDALIARLERRKVGAVRCPRKTVTEMARPQRRRRYIPAGIGRAVWERDQGQCTFVGANGKRCSSRRFLEFDHVEPVARGGKTSVAGMRLRCRAHNQYEAERVFGHDFMRQKRDEARIAARKSREAKIAATQARPNDSGQEQFMDVMAGLRALGCRPDDARRAAEFSGTAQGTTIEERMRLALQFLGRKSAAIRRSGTCPGACGRELVPGVGMR